MSKEGKKNKVKIPSGLSNEVGAMIEHFDSRLGFVAEQTGQIMKDVSVLKDDVAILKDDVSVLKDDATTLKDDMQTVKNDLEIIKYSLKKKVDLDDFHALERRVALLENRR